MNQPPTPLPHRRIDVRSKSELVKEVQALSVTKAVIYRNVDKKAWERIAKEYVGVRMVVISLA